MGFYWIVARIDIQAGHAGTPVLKGFFKPFEGAIELTQANIDIGNVNTG